MLASLRNKAYLILETNGSFFARFVNIGLLLLILLNVIAVVAESVRPIFLAHKANFLAFEIFSVTLFSIEYLLRLWVAPENPDFKQSRFPRLAFMRSGMAIIDLLAIAPFYLSMFISIDTRMLRGLRLLRIFKLTRYSTSMDLMVTVIKKELPNIASALFVMAILIILSASGIYFVERDAQPEAFGSIPSALWWATVTLTTVGYGDVYPITLGGRIFGMIIMLTGVGMAALPAGILASGYSRELSSRRELYEAELKEALEDGVLSEEEQSHLKNMQKELGIRDDEVDSIKNQSKHIECPHCKKQFIPD